MANAIFSYENHVDRAAAVLSSSGHLGGLAPSNMAHAIVGKRCRISSLTGYGQVDFGADVDVGVLCLRFPRDTMGALAGTVRHRLDADGGTPGTGAADDSTAISINAVEGYGYHLYKLSAAVAARYWRFTFNASGVTYIDVGRAWAGEVFQPVRNFSYGIEDIWGDLSAVGQSPRSGAEYVDARARQRMIGFGLPNMTTADKDTVREMQRICGASQQLVFMKDPTDTSGKEIILGRMGETNPIAHTSFPIHATTFRIRESL
jgi:hypothetical protein